MIVSSSKCKSVVVYDLYGVCIQTLVSFLCDPKGSRVVSGGVGTV